MSNSTKRSLQVAELIWRNLASMLCQYMREPTLSTVIITHVKVSNDLSKATVFFTLLDKGTLKTIKKLLIQETKRIRVLMSKRVKLRYVPEIKFIYDDFTEKKEKLLNLINRLPCEREK
jgi:ribosome-binding factor A